MITSFVLFLVGAGWGVLIYLHGKDREDFGTVGGFLLSFGGLQVAHYAGITPDIVWWLVALSWMSGYLFGIFNAEWFVLKASRLLKVAGSSWRKATGPRQLPR